MAQSIINSLLFKPPHHDRYNFPSPVLTLVTSRNERIAATFLQRLGATVTVLFSHGNAEDLSVCYPFMRRLSRQLNVNVIGYDYTGYGASTGEPSEENCYADIEAVFRFLLEEENLSPHEIVLYGRSLGSGPSCYLAWTASRKEQDVGGLILHSPFASVYRVVLNFGVTLPGDKFPNIDRIDTVQCPILILHGTEDKVVPFDHGVELLNRIPEKRRTKPFWMEGSGHNNHGPKVEAQLMEHCNHFLDYYVLARRLWLTHSSAAGSSLSRRRTRVISKRAQPKHK